MKSECPIWGLQIIYHLLNKLDNVFCERVFAPASDMEGADEGRKPSAIHT